jgi:hypothetical protein
MTEPGASSVVAAAVHTVSGVHRWSMPGADLTLDETPGSPWVLVPPAVRRVFDLVADAGRPLAETDFGPPMLGVKCGCNDAFLVTLDAMDAPAAVPAADLARVRVADRRAPSRHGLVERGLLRPIVRGETLRPWSDSWPVAAAAPTGSRRRVRHAAPEWIVWTHEESGGGRDAPLPALPAHAAQWLAPWRHRLAARTDTRGRPPWWALFRTDSACGTWPRVVWADIGRRPRATALLAGDRTVPLNSCYAVRGHDATDAHALVTVLNSDVAAAWLNAVAEPARGGFHRYLGWTVGLLPLPRDWERVRDALAVVGQEAAAGQPPPRAVLTDRVAAAYGIAVEQLTPLLEWSRS